MTATPAARAALVTGGAGFIGSHIAERLLVAGYQVHILDNESTGLRANAPSARPTSVATRPQSTTCASPSVATMTSSSTSRGRRPRFAPSPTLMRTLRPTPWAR
ncbi:MAG: GDP-mannose 4,6-dehydratase [Anaerolineae bacterium]|nr:GDP-mannose 4,6-dehydratase [Anaerolineae bacterium]